MLVLLGREKIERKFFFFVREERDNFELTVGMRFWIYGKWEYWDLVIDMS